LDHCVRPDRHAAWVRQIELAKDNLVAPDLTKEILEDVNRQLFPGTPPVAEAERSEPRIVTHWTTCPVDDAEHRAETAIGDVHLASVFHLKIGDIERTACEPYLATFVFVDLGTCGHLKIPLWIERICILPMNRVEAGAGVARSRGTVP
jgi:hypothetical protein